MEDGDGKKRKRIGNVFNDVDMFVRACNSFKRQGTKASITQAAEELDISPTGLIECLRRLKLEYGQELVKIKPKRSGVEITAAGNIVLSRSRQIFDVHEQIKSEVNFDLNKKKVTKIRVSTSPYLLAHVFPFATSAYSRSDKNNIVTIECEEGYFTSDIVSRIAAGIVDFAVVWNYPEKVRIVMETPKVDFASASVKIKPIVVFGKNHHFRNINEQEIEIERLKNETMLVLEAAHQPLYDLIPKPSVGGGGKTIEFTTIASIIGSIRAGMDGVAVLPAIFKDLDRYRRDGSLYFLSLGSDSKSKGEDLHIDIMYLFRSITEKSATEKTLQPLREKNLTHLNRQAVSFLNFIDSRVLKEISGDSGWNHAIRPGLRIEPSYITNFTHSYHISSEALGMSEPEWKHSTISLCLRPATVGKRNSKVFYDGLMKRGNPGSEFYREYTLEGELVEDTIFCLIGRWNGGNECFVANLNFIDPDRKYLSGIVSGQDDLATSPMACSFVLSTEDLTNNQLPPRKNTGLHSIELLSKQLKIVKSRTLMRTDIENIAF